MFYIATVFLAGLFIGIVMSIAICRLVEKGVKPQLDNFVHYVFRSDSYVRTKIMDNLIDTIQWDKYFLETQSGTMCKICGVFENTTNIEIRNIVLEFRFLDSDGVIIKTENHIEYGNTLPGEKRRLSISVYDIDFDNFNVIARTNSFAEIPHF